MCPIEIDFATNQYSDSSPITLIIEIFWIFLVVRGHWPRTVRFENIFDFYFYGHILTLLAYMSAVALKGKPGSTTLVALRK